MDGVLFDLLMAVMNSLDLWTAAVGDERRGLAWRDAVTARMTASDAYVPYEALIADAAAEIRVPAAALPDLLDRWTTIEPWPDAAAVRSLTLPYGFVTNCSADMARVAAGRSGLEPRLVLSAEDAGWYKPDRRIYEEACGKLGSAPDRTVFVAGSPYDAAGAKAAGMHACLVIRRPDHRPQEPSIRTVASLEEVVALIDGANLPSNPSGTRSRRPGT